MVYCSIVMKNDTELYHYGVKGMKWGKRNKHRTGVKGRDGSKVSSKDGKPLKVWQNISTPYHDPAFDPINPPNVTAYESNDSMPTYETTSSMLNAHYTNNNSAKGSKYIQALTKVKVGLKVNDLKVTKTAINLCNSKAPLPIKLLGIGVSMATNKITNKAVSKINTLMLKSAMKKK